MYGVYDYGVVTHTHTHARAHNLWKLAPWFCDNLPQRHFFNLQQDYRRHVWDIDIVDQPTR